MSWFEATVLLSRCTSSWLVVVAGDDTGGSLCVFSYSTPIWLCARIDIDISFNSSPNALREIGLDWSLSMDVQYMHANPMRFPPSIVYIYVCGCRVTLSISLGGSNIYTYRFIYFNISLAYQGCLNLMSDVWVDATTVFLTQSHLWKQNCAEGRRCGVVCIGVRIEQ